MACAARSLVPLPVTTAVRTALASLRVGTQVRSQNLSGGRTGAQLCSLHSPPPSWGQVASAVVPSACAENPPCLEQKCMITSHLSYLTENTEGPKGDTVHAPARTHLPPSLPLMWPPVYSQPSHHRPLSLAPRAPSGGTAPPSLSTSSLYPLILPCTPAETYLRVSCLRNMNTQNIAPCPPAPGPWKEKP